MGNCRPRRPKHNLALLEAIHANHVTCVRDEDLAPTYTSSDPRHEISRSDHEQIQRFVLRGLVAYSHQWPANFGSGKLHLTPAGEHELADLRRHRQLLAAALPRAAKKTA
ncbi:hypothetical protein ACWEOE_31755 [Amycolatopsis sp. NPDC004368]